jgi:hypothetical protein
MRATEQTEQERSTGISDNLSRIPTRRLALATGIMSVVALGLALTRIGAGDAQTSPMSTVIGQQLWNAAQVGLLLLLLCMWLAHRRWWVFILAGATVACLPFAIYVLSPGGWALTALLLMTCAAGLLVRAPDLNFMIADAPARVAPLFAKFEFLAFVCTLLCSMYNFQASKAFWPNWGGVFANVATAIGFRPDIPAVARGMYTLGLKGVTMPSYVPVGDVTTGNLGAVVFALIWTFLPFLYVLYFALLAKMAQDSPGTRIQQFLCCCCVLHFLFLTDFVDYKYGRGVLNPFTEVFHWTERFAWRIAILLPIYQKVATGYFRRGNGVVGQMLHYALAGWAVFFFVYYVLMVDLPRFFQAVFNGDRGADLHGLLGIPFNDALRYHGALVLMTFLYGLMAFALRCKRIFVIEEPLLRPA